MTLILEEDIQTGSQVRASLVVVGAGPAGIICAVEASAKGVDVVLVESGGTKPRHGCQTLSAADVRHPELHAPVEMTVSRQVGGTSAIWGGRCVPYDPVDFQARHRTGGSVWPIEFDEVSGYFERACEWFHCGRAAFDVGELDHLPKHMVPGLVDGTVRTSSLERWSLPTDFGKAYARALRKNESVRLITGAACVQIVTDEVSGRATHIECRTLGGKSFTVHGDDIIVAAGGLESTRLLLCSPGPSGRSIGDHSGHLGHWYMAHMEGVIADLVLATAADETMYDYERDVDGVYVRRRFSFDPDHLIACDLPNVVGWIANPELSDASHGSAHLSLTYLALLSPLGALLAPRAQRLSLTGTRIPGTPYGTAQRSPIWAHVRNILRHPIETICFGVDFGFKRVFSTGRKPPGFFVFNAENRYPLQYHGEHLPNYDSQVRLSSQVDAVDMPKLEIDIVFAEKDVEGVVAAHAQWDQYLRDQGVGRLDYHADDVAAAVRARIGGGFHQCGTTRMSRDPEHGVVDENLTIHGIPNVHVVSSSVLVTSSQANSTFMVGVLAIRLIEHLHATREAAASPAKAATVNGNTFAAKTSLRANTWGGQDCA